MPKPVIEIDNYSNGEPPRVPAVVGMRVKIFNQVSDDFHGHIEALNKRTARIKVDEKIQPFTEHLDAREPYDDGWYKLVPYWCIRAADPRDQ